MPTPPVGRLPVSEQPAAITRLIVQVIAEMTGRGPTKVRTHLCGDVITVVMRDTFTKAERNLVAEGHGELVITMRRTLQQSLSPIVVPAVETITGRRVEAFLSDQIAEPDVAIETFLLSRIELSEEESIKSIGRTRAPLFDGHPAI